MKKTEALLSSICNRLIHISFCFWIYFLIFLIIGQLNETAEFIYQMGLVASKRLIQILNKFWKYFSWPFYLLNFISLEGEHVK